jgi:hypothetical protein
VLDAPHVAKAALPGHYVIIDKKFACYVLGQQNGLEIIVDASEMDYLQTKKQVEISSLQGEAFSLPNKNQLYLVTAEDEGLSAVVFYCKKYRAEFHGLVLVGSSKTFPFAPCPSKLVIPSLPSNVIASIPLLEDWGVPNRLASIQEAPGVYEGTVEDLAKMWLSHAQTNIFKVSIPSLSHSSIL